jgi:amino acid transporter
MPAPKNLRRLITGAPLDPLDPNTRQHVALIAFFAWVGLGADGLSSSCYGPEEAFLALGSHTHFGLYLAVAIAVTVFIISLAYNQVIELFPNGGGGYKVATNLLGPHAGLVSGAALIVDYVLTIAISIASGADAMFSLLPLGLHSYKIGIEFAAIILLVALNLRGMKEAIKFLLPIFIGFVVVHVVLICYGIYAHADRLPALIPDTLSESAGLARETGWIFVVSTILLAYSQGGGTYTGLEAVSNNVNTLAEPRIATGKWTMFYMATSLAFTAGGIMLLYLLWNVTQSPGQTLNAVVFKSIIDHFDLGGVVVNSGALIGVLVLEAGLLFVAANTGFLGGPAVLSNMAADSWVPRQFRQLSSRLVTQNGVVLMGGAALAVLVWSQGQRRPAGRALQHQRVPHVFHFAVRAVRLLDQEPPQRAPLEAAVRAVGNRPIRDERHTAHTRMGEIRHRRLGDYRHHRPGDHGVSRDPLALRRDTRAIAPDRPPVCGPARAAGRCQPARARSAKTDRRIFCRQKPRRQHARAAVGAAALPRTFQELHFSERRRGRRAELRRPGRAAHAALRDRELAALLRELLPQPRARREIVSGIRHRSGSGADQAVRPGI